MTSFDSREKGFENKFAHDEELAFKTRSRRNRLLGLWAAEKLGKSGAEADAYVSAFIVAALDKPSDNALIAHLLAELAPSHPELKEKHILGAMEDCYATAKKQIMGE
ncbi:MAG: DUF1476 domain-containing protein [Alphaproteobacteria bacterium]|nr:DUF1476 domain-containing protein [Alphaproteobacteria bacterium]